MHDTITAQPLPLAGLLLLNRDNKADSRGSFERLYCASLFRRFGIESPIDQINLTHTLRRGTVRGMHFQRFPNAEDKVVSCLRGRVLDVAVDVRPNSPTFLKWHAVELSPDAYNALLIPKGFAHGFQTMTDDCEMLYFHTASYSPADEGGINPADPRLDIDWPLRVTEISERDFAHPFIDENFVGVTV